MPDTASEPGTTGYVSAARRSIWLRGLICLGVAAVTLVAPVPLASGSTAIEPVHIKVVGGLGGVKQYQEIEQPFWSQKIRELSGGRITASIHSFDRSGLRGQEMLQLIRLGVVPFGTAILSLVSGDEPELNAVDLPGLNPDVATLRLSVAAYRPHVEKLMRDRYGIELLGVYTYPAQVLFCAKPFAGLGDLAGRKIRTSSVGQSEMMAALGAVPVITPFAEMVGAVSKGVVDCAITGTLSGHQIGLSEVTTHIHTMAIGWGLSLFGANSAAWDNLPAQHRDIIRSGVAELEQKIWEAAEGDTQAGLACSSGADTCSATRRGRMTVVAISPQDEALRRKLLGETVLPSWIDRCGEPCVEAWHETLGPLHAIAISAPQAADLTDR
ncbi:MAG: TRAP transporter substrate-binding protein [Hyphomicrobiaceae bacterium]